MLALLAFESTSGSNPLAEFQAVSQRCIAKALAAGKKKLVVDLSNNDGGYILQGYDFFRQLFPHLVQDGCSRQRESDSFLAISDIYSDAAAGLDPATSANSSLIGISEQTFNWRHDLNLTNQPFTSFADKFAPHVFKDTPYTSLMRWNLDDQLTTTNSSFGVGIEISGYGTLANLTQPFAAEDIVMLLDGHCASTCTLAAEMLRTPGRRQVGRGGAAAPRPGPIQGVGGVKGVQSLTFTTIFMYVLNSAFNAATGKDFPALEPFIDPLPLQRSTNAGINARDQILRDNVNDACQPSSSARRPTAACTGPRTWFATSPPCGRPLPPPPSTVPAAPPAASPRRRGTIQPIASPAGAGSASSTTAPSRSGASRNSTPR